MSRYARILVPVDLSPGSLAALDHAREFAETFGSEVVLAHVTPPQDDRVLYEDVCEIHPSMAERIHEYVLRRLEALRRTFPEAGAVRCTHVEGDPRSSLIELCRSEDIDLVVMTTHGRTGAAHVILGSVAEELARSAPCPVLIVRERRGAA